MKDISYRVYIDDSGNEPLAQMAIALCKGGRLCIIHEEEQIQELRTSCSMGLIK